MKKQSHQHLVALALAAIAMAMSLAMLVRLVPSPIQMLARGISQELDDASPATVGLHLTQLEALQTDALPALVDALGSNRMDVSRGARRLIDGELDRWQALPPNVASRHVEHLARLLATHTRSYNATSREHARQLVMRILQWPIDRDEVDRTQLLATCEIVLRTAGQFIPATLVSETPNQTLSEAAAADLETSGPWQARKNDDSVSVRVSDDPSFAPVLPLETPFLPDTAPEPGIPRPPVAEDQSRASQSTGDDRLPLATSRPSIGTQEPRIATPLFADSRPLRNTPDSMPARDALRQAETIAVMRWLLVEAAAARAIDELSARGFSEVQIHVARQLVNPDPMVRLKLAKSLPNLAAIDPRPWLLWLSRDIDPEIRRATVAILATSPDPAFQDRLRELELEETDESVLRVVRRALAQRGRSF